MSTPTSNPAAGVATLPAGAHLGPAHLTVSDLDRSVAWYQDVAGVRVLARDDETASLGADQTVLVLHEDPQAQPLGRRAGLFHVALLYPSRPELSRTARRLAERALPITGASDHGVSEAIYLRDPDENGVELYADRPREDWPAPAPGSPDRIGMYTRPLDVEALLAVTDGESAVAHAGPGLTVGHIHLQVGDDQQAIAFYRDVIGFDLMGTYTGAAFMATGGYHHHVATNMWVGRNLPPAPEHTATLREWTVFVPTSEDVDAIAARAGAAGAPVDRDGDAAVIRDPWGIAMRVAVEPV